MQTKASFKKEFLAFWRSKKLIILTCVIITLALFGAALTRGMSEIPGFSEMYSVATSGVQAAISYIAEIGLLVFILLLNSHAGGEQKRRSIIIPQSSGLGSASYIFPKFIFYPLVVFALSIIGTLAASGLSVYFFEDNNLIMSQVLAGGAVLGVYLMMYVCFHLCIGTATGRAGASAAICIVAALLLPTIFEMLSVAGQFADIMAGEVVESTATYAYNPFALSLMAQRVVGGNAETQDIVMTLAFAFALMVIVYFIALFAQNARKIDNSGNEILI